MKFSDMEFENDKTPVLKEIWDYYCSHKEYSENMIPLNADTATEIAKILDKKEKDVASWNDWPENKTPV